MDAIVSVLRLVAGMLVACSAAASPISLPGGPLYITLSNVGQFSASNAIGSGEGAWGLLQVTAMEVGKVVGNTIVPGNGPAFFSAGQSGGNQITGMYYGISNVNAGQATGGFLDLYWQDVSNASTAAEGLLASGAARRLGQNTYTGFTVGTLLLHAAFASGCQAVPTTTVCLSPGSATGYLNVLGGVWAPAFDNNFFVTPHGLRDIRSETVFGANPMWDVAGTDIVGTIGSDAAADPITGLAIPEPGSLALTVIALIALRRASQAKPLAQSGGQRSPMAVQANAAIVQRADSPSRPSRKSLSAW